VKRRSWAATASALAVSISLTLAATQRGQADDSSSLQVGAPPAAPIVTFWNKLGIPQGFNKLFDARANRLGSNPDSERVPPLTRIADPANLQSPNPAIQTAAKIKADQDLAPQKIKALMYLGTVGCCCPANRDQIKNAMLAALDDCTKEVREQAALSICHAAQTVCPICNRCNCCTADVMNKLNKMATEQDEHGCWIEPSAEVRAAACAALDACRRARRPVAAAPSQPTPSVQPKEHVVPTPPAPPKPVPPRAAQAGEGLLVNPLAVSVVGYSEISDSAPEPAPTPKPGPTAAGLTSPKVCWEQDARHCAPIIQSKTPAPRTDF
jgi:hypothetical protein